MCQELKPVKEVSIDIKVLLARHKLGAREFEVSEYGDMVYVVGRRFKVKRFMLCYNKKEKKVVNLQDYGVFETVLKR